jgi:hypothetical protein
MLNGMLEDSAITPENLTKTIIGLANWVKGTENGKATDEPQGITFGASGRTFSPDTFNVHLHGLDSENAYNTAANAGEYLIDTCGWTITPSPLTVATPTISAKAGSDFEISLETTTDGANIYYTTNGDDPTKLDTLYSKPFNVATGITVKAIAIKTGWNDSAIAQLYVG